MKKQKVETSRVAVHFSPARLNLTNDQALLLVNDGLIDAFFSKALVVTQTPERADDLVSEARTDPHFESRYRNASVARATSLLKKQGKTRLGVPQFQLDTQTFVLCLNVDRLPVFETTTLFVFPESPEMAEYTQDSKDIFCGFSHEGHHPEMRDWHDIPFDDILRLPPEVFKNFVKILFRRLFPLFLARIRDKASPSVFAVTEGLNDPLFEPTFLSVFSQTSRRKTKAFQFATEPVKKRLEWFPTHRPLVRGEIQVLVFSCVRKPPMIPTHFSRRECCEKTIDPPVKFSRGVAFSATTANLFCLV